YSDAGYELPPLTVEYHEVPTNHTLAGWERDGQGLLLTNTNLSLSHAARERRQTLKTRMQQCLSLVEARLPEQHIVWCELAYEQKYTEKLLGEAAITYS